MVGLVFLIVGKYIKAAPSDHTTDNSACSYHREEAYGKENTNFQRVKLNFNSTNFGGESSKKN